MVEKQPMILKWRILSATNDLDRVSAVALPKLPISISNTDLKVAADTKFCPGLGTDFISFLLIVQCVMSENHYLLLWGYSFVNIDQAVSYDFIEIQVC